MNVENKKTCLGYLRKLPHLVMLGFVGLLFVSTSYSADDDKQIVSFSLPTNGDFCKRCETSYSPNSYYAELQEFFNDPDNQKYSRDEIIASVGELVKKELTDLAVLVGQRNEDNSENLYFDSEIDKKIEGFKVLASTLRIHYGQWSEEIVKSALSSENEICAFTEAGNICEYWNYADGDGECSKCQNLSFFQILDLMKNGKKAFHFKNSLTTPSKIADKFAGKEACNEDTKPQSTKSDKAKLFCGILNSERIIESFTTHQSLAYVGFEDNSYSCKKVGLFFRRNAKTHKIEPDPDRSFLVYPDGTREDLDDDQVKQIIENIYQAREF